MKVRFVMERKTQNPRLKVVHGPIACGMRIIPAPAPSPEATQLPAAQGTSEEVVGEAPVVTEQLCEVPVACGIRMLPSPREKVASALKTVQPQIACGLRVSPTPASLHLPSRPGSSAPAASAEIPPGGAAAHRQPPTHVEQHSEFPVACGLRMLSYPVVAEQKEAPERRRKGKRANNVMRKKEERKRVAAERRAAKRVARQKKTPVSHSSEDMDKLRKSLENLQPLSFSVDLVLACETLLSSIAAFGELKELHATDHLEMALVRYEFFLALYCNVAEAEGEEAARRLVPPCDVAHAWRAHLIRPITYREDCQELFHRQISPAVLFSDVVAAGARGDPQKEARAAAEVMTKERWDSMVAAEGLPHMEYAPSTVVPDSFPVAEVSIGVPHLREDLSWWTKFQEFWGLEYDSDRRLFLEKRQESYKNFLRSGAARTLAKLENPATEVDLQGPPVDVDVFWHCHMMFPEAYDADLRSQLGCVFYHEPAADAES